MKMRGDRLMGTRWLLSRDDSCDKFQLPMEPEPKPNQTLLKIAPPGRPRAPPPILPLSHLKAQDPKDVLEGH